MESININGEQAGAKEGSESMCKNLRADQGSNGWTAFECSECGATIGGKDADGGAPEEICFVVYEDGGCGWSPFSYCPHCGAKVVENAMKETE